MDIPLLGVTSETYRSSFFSQYHPWLVHMGYPTLDIVTYEDGSWAIIELQDGGYIPSEAKFKVIMGFMENLEPSYSTIKKLVSSIDVCKDAFWERERLKTQRVEDEWEAAEAKKMELADQATALMTGNPDLMERVAKKGLSMLQLKEISKFVPRHKL